MGFFDSQWVSSSINASNATFAALGSTNALIGNPMAQTGYASIMNSINNAIRFGQAAASMPQSQTAGAINSLDGNDFVNASGTSFIDFYTLGTNTSFAARQVAVGVATNAFNPVVRIIDFTTGNQLVAWDANNTGIVITNFIAEVGHNYAVTVESLQPAVGKLPNI